MEFEKHSSQIKHAKIIKIIPTKTHAMLAIMQYPILLKMNDNKGILPIANGPFTGWDLAFIKNYKTTCQNIYENKSIETLMIGSGVGPIKDNLMFSYILDN